MVGAAAPAVFRIFFQELVLASGGPSASGTETFGTLDQGGGFAAAAAAAAAVAAAVAAVVAAAAAAAAAVADVGVEAVLVGVQTEEA